MRTLVIHPKDKSTDFLKPLYENIENKLVLSENLRKDELFELIPQFDRVMMMGHGSPYGLFNTVDGICKGYIIDGTIVRMLKDNPNNVYIWCHANMFVETYRLKGFYSGMFISEVVEAKYFGIITNQKIVDQSNNSFVRSLSKVIELDGRVMFSEIRKRYSVVSRKNPIAFYNQQRLYYSS